ncbi:MAG: CPBP family intramembrane metalloprotease [Rhodospirillales bacterium]|nr:CPBP family intramembrane metalloprotease [Rhodospirillales bacterium]
MLYRALLPCLLLALGWRPGLILIASSFAFGLIHWSHGVASIADAFIAGLLLMIVVRRTRSLLPAIGAHYAIDLVLFA